MMNDPMVTYYYCGSPPIEWPTHWEAAILVLVPFLLSIFLSFLVARDPDVKDAQPGLFIFSFVISTVVLFGIIFVGHEIRLSFFT